MAGKAKATPAPAARTQLEVVDTCGLCHWWKRINGGVGRCKRFPPVPMPGSAGVWPMSLAEDYCGEFEARAVEAAKPVGFAPPGPPEKCPGCGVAFMCAEDCPERAKRQAEAGAA